MDFKIKTLNNFFKSLLFTKKWIGALDLVKPNEDIRVKVMGHLLISDAITGEVLVDKSNQINFENFSLAIVEAMSHNSSGIIKFMNFGSGAATVSGIGTVTYLQPNVIGENATLYNQTYQKLVDGQNLSNLDPSRNKMVTSHVAGNLFSDLIVSCTLDSGEPVGQDAFDNGTNMNADFVFNEIGLESYGGKLLSMVVFSPVQKSLNRILAITYTIRVQLV